MNIGPGTEKHDVVFYTLPFMLHKNFVDYPYYSDLGMLINAAACLEAGFNVGVVDALAQPYTEPIEQGKDHYWIGCRTERIKELTKEMCPRIAVICGHSFLNIHVKSKWLTNLIDGIESASPGCTIVYADCYVGGMHFVDVSADRIMENYPKIKHVVKHHSEVQLCLIIAENIKPSPESRTTVRQGSIHDIYMSDFPFPAWEQISIENYSRYTKAFFKTMNRVPVFNLEKRTLPAVVSRGCHYRCSFCSSSPGTDTPIYKRMDSKRIYEMLESYRDSWGAGRIAFLDGLANPTKGDFDELLDIMEKLDLNYDFLNGLRADKLTREQIVRMKDRVTSLAISAESGSQEILEKIGKGLKVGAVERVAEWCMEIGVSLVIHYVVGFPGETLKSIQKTFSNADDMKRKYRAFTSVQFATPFPGTPLYEECKKAGILSTDEVLDYSPYFSTGGLINNTKVSDAELRKAYECWRKADGSESVEKVIINLTYMCNNKCVFCAIGDRNKEHSKLEDVLRAISVYKKRGARLLDFDGGEPTLYPELPGVIKASVKAGFERVSVTTNGRKLSDEGYARELISSGITDLLISLYGTDSETHDTLTGSPGSFDETVSGIKNAVKFIRKEQSLSVNTTLGRTNYKKLPDIALFASLLGIKRLNVQMLTPFGSATKEHAPDPSESAPYIIEAVESAGELLKIQVINMPPCLLPGHEEIVAQDTAKRERDMVFIGEAGTNLAGYLSSKRIKTEECHACVYLLVCDGKYQFT